MCMRFVNHLSFLLAFMCVSAHVGAQSNTVPIEYIVTLDEPQTQMVDISVIVNGIDDDEDTIDFVLPTWRPGRYVILDPAGTVRGVHATDNDTGEVLRVQKTDKTTWRVNTSGAPSIRLDYRMYANSLGDRTRHVDDSHAFLSGSSVFMFNPKRRDHPVRVTLDMPDTWRVATGLRTDQNNGRALAAPSFDVLVDSPLELGMHDRIEFDVSGISHEIIIWPEGIPHDAERLIDDFTKIIEASIDVFGQVPYERYVFLIHAGAGAGGGTEHLNSTIMQTGRGSIEGTIDNDSTYKRFLGLVAHEFIHTWNVKQFRPAGISPYNYVDENYTTLFWVAEGTTCYYDELLRVRTGHMKPKKYLDDLASQIGTLRDRPGARVQSLAESSFDAWIKFNRHSPDDINSEISFYGKGELASLLLDLEIRKRTDNKASLDDVMRDLATEFHWPGAGYTPEDLQRIIEARAGGRFDEFFTRFIDGTDQMPFEEAFAVVGLDFVFEPVSNDEEGDEEDESDGESESTSELRPATMLTQKPYLGLDLTGSGNFARVRAVRSDGPAYDAGLIVDDEVIALNGRRLRASDLDNRMKQFEIGDSVTFTIMRRDELREIEVTIAGKPDGTWKLRKTEDPSDVQRAAYESWLGHPWE